MNQYGKYRSRGKTLHRNKCIALGKFKDNPDTLRNAISYLEEMIYEPH